MREIVLIAHNLRSAHNVGSLLRTADGLGIQQVYLTGYTPYPKMENDTRLPHLAAKIDKQIAKTALGAEQSVDWKHETDVKPVIANRRKQGFMVAAVEQAPGSVKLPDYKPPEKLILIVGREVEGLEPEVIELCDQIVEIPMVGRKESFNVTVAAAMAMYHCRYL